MNLDAMNVTPAQRASITRVEGPLLICAGAGSGKTFTLQQRIAYGLSAQSGPAVEGIDRLLAITFTTKAADEIKSRVRAALREQGMSDQALKVDDAWISTIHSMALRILDEYALELGFVPGCASLSSAEAAAIRDEAYRVVIEQPGCWDELVAMYGPSQAWSMTCWIVRHPLPMALRRSILGGRARRLRRRYCGHCALPLKSSWAPT